MDRGDSIAVFLKLIFDSKDRRFKNLVNRDAWYFDYRVATSYENRNGIYNHYAFAKRLLSDKNEFVFSFNVPKIDASSLYLFVVIYDDEDVGYIQDIPLQILDKKLYSKYLPFDASGIFPEFESFINRRDTVVFFSENNVELRYCKYNFQPALPPMSEMTTGDGEMKLVVDSTHIIKSDSLVIFKKKGNYAIGNEGEVPLNLLVVDYKFPKVSKVKELVDPVIYIATDEERKILRSSAKPKVKLDDFWMDLGQDKEFARKMIRNYYKKVDLANKYFSCHKEGWKTDMGMVYIVFGKPDEVFRNDIKETWNFKKRNNVPALRFIFNKRKGPFGDYYYELENNPDYASIWYEVVEMWRKGEF